jgi:hypothetical protein
MASILRMKTSRAQRALVSFREEQRAFRTVLELLKQWKREDLFVKVFAVYRSRMKSLRKVAGALLSEVEPSSAADDLRSFSNQREPPAS